MKEIIKKIIIFIKKNKIIILIFILIVLTIFMTNGNKKNEINKNKQQITPVPTIEEKQTDIDYKEDDLEGESIIPYRDKRMMIARYLDSNTLEVIIARESDKDEAQKEIINWANKFGINLDEYKFVFKIQSK